MRSRCPGAGSRLPPGIGTRSSPRRYRPVSESGWRRMSSTVPSATTSPPNAARARTEVDDVVGGPDGFGVVLHDDDRVARGRAALAACRAAVRCPAGAGRCSARRGCRARPPAATRSGWRAGCAAPRHRRGSWPPVPASGTRAPRPAESAAGRRTSLRIGPAMSGSRPADEPRSPRRGIRSKNSIARSTGRSTTSPMLAPCTVTARLSGRSRRPPHVWQGCSIMNSSSEARTASLEDSR